MAAREDRNMVVEGSSMRENRFMQHAIATLRTSGLMRVVLMCMVVLSLLAPSAQAHDPDDTLYDLERLDAGLLATPPPLSLQTPQATLEYFVPSRTPC
jgi:hypothetical protein